MDRPPELQISEDEIRRILEEIERRQIVLKAEQDAEEVFAGVMEFVGSNGWTVWIFNDAMEWDYLDRIQAPDGRSVTFDELAKAGSDLIWYRPDSAVSILRYAGLP